MNELLMALGLQLAIDEISIKVQTFKVFIPESTSPAQISSSGVWTLGSQYTHTPYFIPTSIWYYQTEFGQQLEKYNASKMQNYQYPYQGSLQGLQGIISSQPGHVITTTGAGTFGGLYGGALGISQQQLGQSQQLSQQQQAQISQQQAAQAQARYPIVSTPYAPSGQMILQSPTSQVKITNIQDSGEEDKKSWVQRIKEWVSGTTS